ncbi:Integrase catalytic region [Dyadobacter fermentans DSM 18053]|uniref:Integrase catalytic region n=1 Tax=Dyadobacter fermentans (strain ATCC 700827 / DSM 18053 / CIP 107007 / KCTC 52180 / NS114) TaxID=471854 RepID=C6VUX9_DYAFD|nr:Integrase catalytic region [Dyadobacter fermentans DSM 18053]ACT95644.1 Integrase catalytic region [Dyadobacter fermentans DSM 18053]
MQRESQVKTLVERERKLLPRLGTRKLYHQLRESLSASQIRFGRDQLFDLMRKHRMLIVPKRRYVQTTMSKHWLRKYPNLAKDLKVTRPDQLWVSDITYLKTDEGNCYLNLVTDAYSRKIMGYAIADNMEAVEMKKAFQMAVKCSMNGLEGLIHHSDRGLQYCSAEYTSIARFNHINISMTENSDPYENALAERMNKTMKEEFGLGNILPSRKLAGHLVDEAVQLYNNYRPHLSLQMQTPEYIYKQKSQSQKQLGSL